MTVQVRPPTSGRAARFAAAVDRMVAWMARHWLPVFNTIAAVFVLLPFLAPVLMHLGLTGPARVIYLVYSPACHQLPERSFFLFGELGAYTVAELEAERAIPAGLTLFQREMLRYIGNPQIGYKVAICERDIAIYGCILLGGLIYGTVRRRRARRGQSVPRLPLKGYLALLAPMAIDGTTQLVGLRESTWELRLITGALFGLGTVWLAYPYVDEAMQDSLKALPTEGPRVSEMAP